MKTLHIISACAQGGAEIFVRDLVIALRSEGHEAIVAYFSSARDLGTSASFEAAFQRELREAGVTLVQLGHSARMPILGRRAIGRVIREHRPDVVHTHMFRAALALSFRRETPHVYTHHNTLLPAGGHLFRLLDTTVSTYVAISEANAAFLRRLTALPVQLIYNGIRNGRIKFAGIRTLPEQPLLISVGRLCREKDYPTLLHAIRILRQRDPKARTLKFVIAGDGPERPNVERLVRDLDLTACVELLGNRGDVDELLATATAYIMTSATEGFPISLIEATASGLPIICSDVGGCREIVEHGRSGVVVPPGDALAFADAIAYVTSDDGRLRELSNQAHQRGSRFRIDTACRQHILLYSALLRRR